MPAKRIAIPVLLATVLLALAAYWFLGGRQYTVRLSEADLQAEIAARMPFTQTYLLVFAATLDSPRVTFVEEVDRVRVGFDAQLEVRTRRVPETFTGAIEVSGGVRYDPERAELFLTDARVEDATVLRVPPQYQASVNDALSRALTEYFRTRPIYRLEPVDLRHAATRRLLRDVRIEQRQLVLTFGIR